MGLSPSSYHALNPLNLMSRLRAPVAVGKPAGLNGSETELGNDPRCGGIHQCFLSKIQI
jgi:hypothetical protein